MVKVGVLYSRIRTEEKLLIQELQRRHADFTILDDRKLPPERELGRVDRTLQVRAEDHVELCINELVWQVFRLLHPERGELAVLMSGREVLIVVGRRAVYEVGDGDGHVN